jgi:uncharacterized protein (TIGR03118 family)
MANFTLLSTCYARETRRHVMAWLCAGVLAATAAGTLAGANSYFVHNLVSDLPSTADHVDANLVNPWGVASSPTSPFWVANNHSGTSTLYDTSGTAIPLIVKIPSPAGSSAAGSPTGAVFNGSQMFLETTGGKPALFIFCTADGTIASWNGGDSTQAQMLINNSASGAVYTGCAIGGTTDAPLLYAADFHNAKIDVWGGDLKAVQSSGGFSDTQVPSGYAPYNIVNLNGKLYVSYAKQDDAKKAAVNGAGNGYVAVFDMTGKLLTHLIAQGPLNSPWGMTIAPATFGDFANDLLVGNFGDGMIHAFDPNTGTLLGTLNNTSGTPIAIPGLWSLLFGNGGRGGDKATLYFTAGIHGSADTILESHGLFGSIQGAPLLETSGVQNAASFSGTIAPNTWVSIIGGALSPTTRSWQTSDFVQSKLPTQLDGVGVTVNGEAAFISYISPMQINFLVPTDVATGQAQIKVTNSNFSSAVVTVPVQTVAPSFFLFNGTKYIAATHSDNVSLIGPPGLISGATFTAAHAGETIVLYANGFGATNPAAPLGMLLTTALPLVATPTVTIGGVQATVVFPGMSAPGLYQLNVIVPSGLPAGDAVVVAQAGGASSQANAFISVGP